MRVSIPVDKGNAAIQNGKLPQTMETFIQRYKPENAYFTTVDGNRTAFFFLEVQDSSLMPQLSEPFFSELGANVQFAPCMNAQELKRGLEAVMGAAAGAR